MHAVTACHSRRCRQIISVEAAVSAGRQQRTLQVRQRRNDRRERIDDVIQLRHEVEVAHCNRDCSCCGAQGRGPAHQDSAFAGTRNTARTACPDTNPETAANLQSAQRTQRALFECSRLVSLTFPPHAHHADLAMPGQNVNLRAPAEKQSSINDQHAPDSSSRTLCHQRHSSSCDRPLQSARMNTRQ